MRLRELVFIWSASSTTCSLSCGSSSHGACLPQHPHTRVVHHHVEHVFHNILALVWFIIMWSMSSTTSSHSCGSSYVFHNILTLVWFIITWSMSSTTSSHSCGSSSCGACLPPHPHTRVAQRAWSVSFPEVILVSADDMPICHLDCIRHCCWFLWLF